MKVTHLLAAVACVAVGASAIAQTTTPGGNLPQGQGACATGYDKTVKDGRMEKLTPDETKAVDMNSDGRISKEEFDNACAKKLFKEQDSKG